MIPLRSLPRLFIPGIPVEGTFELPTPAADKLRKVLRLGTGDQFLALPDDGTALRCELQGRSATVISVERPQTEPSRSLAILHALPKGDKLDDVLRACTELGATEFTLFPSDRTIVRWDDAKKIEAKLTRAEAVVRDSAEVAFRTRLPKIRYVASLADALKLWPDAVLLDEDEGLTAPLGKPSAIAIGPEGGWTARERALFGDRRATLGPRVLRTEHAAPAATALILLSP